MSACIKAPLSCRTRQGDFAEKIDMNSNMLCHSVVGADVDIGPYKTRYGFIRYRR